MPPSCWLTLPFRLSFWSYLLHYIIDVHIYIYIYYKIAKNTWHIFTWLFLAVKLGLLVKFSVFHRLSGRCVSGAASGAKARSDPGGDSPPGSQGLEGPVPNGGKTKRRSDNNRSKIPVCTAQGGGGSFKNRKPLGEIGCCESGTAERIHWWTERCLRSPLFLSLSLTIYLPTSLSSMYVCMYLSIYLSVYLSIYLSLSLSLICLSV